MVVRPAGEILGTLNQDGTLDGLPFMPEMLRYCGRRFRVFKTAVQICTDGAPVPLGESHVRQFKNDDVVLLEGLRCSGTDHGGCQRSCTLFWKSAWLKRVESDEPPAVLDPASVVAETDGLRGSSGKLCTRKDERYFCQSSTILDSTERIPRYQRFFKCVKNVAHGNWSVAQCAQMVASWCWWKLRHSVLGAYPRGQTRKTPIQVENLTPGERVRVKQLKDIIPTLDRRGCNRGMKFSPDMCRHCGKEYVVRGRVDRIVLEGHGSLRELQSTVVLDGVTSDDACETFGGNPRDEYHYWREVWLERVQGERAPVMPRDRGCGEHGGFMQDLA